MSRHAFSTSRANVGRLSLLVVIASLATLGTAASAAAQSFDHMTCRSVIDGDKAKIKIDVEALDARFGEQRCKLGRARLLCEPATRTSIDPAPELGAVEGDSLAGSFVCYKAKCPTRPAVDLVTDAFGTRKVGKLKSKLLCVPAV
jgi:hypothetical protein